MAECMLMRKLVKDELRECLLNNKVDLIEFIKKMIKLAAKDRPDEFTTVKRTQILDTLYSCEVADAPPRRSFKIRIKKPTPPSTPKQNLQQQNRLLLQSSKRVQQNTTTRTLEEEEKKLELTRHKLHMRYNQVQSMKQKRQVQSLLEQRMLNKIQRSHLATTLKGLDAALCGGISFGTLTELVGPSGILKTQVSDEGDVLYVFPNDYRSKLVAKSFRIRAEP